nr:PREDICTED: uncharacterized protein LOC107075932 isoform X2 [Lepisosteus oculatus]
MINIRYNKRLHLHTNNGSLQINRLKMGDTLTYNVHIVYQDNSQNNNQVKLVVHEKINKPNLETSANFSTINTCNVSVICSTTQGFSASSDCDNRSGVFRCSESNVTNSSVGISITITTKGNTIVCNSSNLVSWNTDRIEQVCQHSDNSTESEEKNDYKDSRSYMILFLILQVFIITCLGVFLGFLRNKARTRNDSLKPEDVVKQNDSPESEDVVKQNESPESEDVVKQTDSPESDGINSL